MLKAILIGLGCVVCWNISDLKAKTFSDNPSDQKIHQITDCAHNDTANGEEISKLLEPDPIQIARRGCCSHHGGVCGCDNLSGRAVCCDGAYSPSCGC